MRPRLVSVVLGTLSVVACASPVAPSLTAETPAAPQHHNIPATFRDHPEGPTYYLCATRPRPYVVAGQTRMEEDHYLQAEPCPAVPVE